MSALRSDPNIAPQEIFTSSTTQATDLGARFTAGDGRVYRYALGSVTALIQGRLYQPVTSDAINLQNLSVLAAGTQTNTVTTSTTVTVATNQLAGGILSVGTSSGFGYTYRVKSHPSATAGTITFTLEDPLQVGLTTGSKIDVTPNPFSGVLVSPGTGAGNTMPLGIATAPTAGSNYGWIQTRGQCVAYSDGAITVGRPVTMSTAVAGAVMALTAGTQPLVGYAMITSTTDKYFPVYVCLE